MPDWLSANGFKECARDRAVEVDACSSGWKQVVVAAGALAAGHIKGCEGALAGAHEPMINGVRVDVASGDCSRRVDTGGERAGRSDGSSARRLERGELATGSPEEAVTYLVRIIVDSRDGPRRVNAGGVCTVDLLRGIECGESSARSPQEPVCHRVRVIVISRDHACWIDGERESAVDPVRDIERCQRAAGVPQEPMVQGICVGIISRNDAGGNGEWEGALVGPGAGARYIEACECTRHGWNCDGDGGLAICIALLCV